MQGAANRHHRLHGDGLLPKLLGSARQAQSGQPRDMTRKRAVEDKCFIQYYIVMHLGACAYPEHGMDGASCRTQSQVDGSAR